jgi:hypothetical protein
MDRKTAIGRAKHICLSTQKTSLIPSKPAMDGKENGFDRTALCTGHGGQLHSGHTSLNQIATYFEEMFNFDLSHFPRDFYEMRIRLDQTPFIDKLRKLLKQRMDDPKRPYDKQ